ncbi:MAG: MobC family plasmid mobilization relaxosome protein [Actinomycetota bacterium]|nr:MobC family plasmid mobilization relaxosome protein [Actinomycetota bacterium]
MAESRVSRRHLPPAEDGRRPVRSEQYRLRMSETERHQLRQRAAAQGVTVSRLLIDSALHSRVSPGERRAVYAQLNRVAGELGKLGGNVNQLAYWANAHQSPAPGTEAAIAEVRGLVSELRAAAEQVATGR